MRRLLGLRLAAVLLVLAGTGCTVGQGFGDLERYVEEVQARPKRKIDPLPKVEVYEAFTYRAANRRSPFAEPETQEASVVDNRPKSSVKPDLDRIREPLESIALGGMSMVGSILKENEKRLYALVNDGQGGIHRVLPGNYLGKNHGKIVSIDESSINLIEIVSDGQGGWFERPRTLGLREE